jgi:DnaJ-domain-containing protein 1
MEKEVGSKKERAARQDKRSNGDYQRAVGELVHREVFYCASGIVYEIGREKLDQWLHLFEQQDWETPTREAIPDLPREKLLEFLDDNDCDVNADSTTETLASACLRHLESAGSWQEFCHDHDLEPQRHEIYEHWIVSDWLARRLEERGEVIERDFYGLTLWGRAATGQAILLDDVICAIYDELHAGD